MADILKSTYSDPATGYRSARKLKRAVDTNIHIKQIEKFVKAQEGHQLTKGRHTDKSKFIHITGPLGTWQLDLIFYEEQRVVNRGYAIFLVCIEVNTRYIVCIPLKKKDQYTVFGLNNLLNM